MLLKQQAPHVAMQLSLFMRHDELSLPRQELSIICWPFGLRSGMVRARGARDHWLSSRDGPCCCQTHTCCLPLRSTATYLHPLTTHEFENAQLMHALFWSPENYPEPGVQGGRRQILIDIRRSAPKKQNKSNVCLIHPREKSKHDSLAEWSTALA